jgi:hypothetical protein
MWWLVACVSPEDSVKEAPPPWCSSLDDVGVAAPAPCTDADCLGSSTAGRVTLWLVTDVGLDPTAPEYTTFKPWTLSPDGGGVSQTGETDGDRAMTALVGAGAWDFASSFVRGGHTCTADLRVDVDIGAHTTGCAQMSCPVE